MSLYPLDEQIEDMANFLIGLWRLSHWGADSPPEPDMKLARAAAVELVNAGLKEQA